MNRTFKRAISSILAFVMVMSCMMVMNVGSIYAANLTETEKYTVGEISANKVYNKDEEIHKGENFTVYADAEKVTHQTNKTLIGNGDGDNGTKVNQIKVGTKTVRRFIKIDVFKAGELSVQIDKLGTAADDANNVKASTKTVHFFSIDESGAATDLISDTGTGTPKHTLTTEVEAGKTYYYGGEGTNPQIQEISLKYDPNSSVLEDDPDPEIGEQTPANDLYFYKKFKSYIKTVTLYTKEAQVLATFDYTKASLTYDGGDAPITNPSGDGTEYEELAGNSTLYSFENNGYTLVYVDTSSTTTSSLSKLYSGDKGLYNGGDPNPKKCSFYIKGVPEGAYVVVNSKNNTTNKDGSLWYAYTELNAAAPTDESAFKNTNTGNVSNENYYDTTTQSVPTADTTEHVITYGDNYYYVAKIAKTDVEGHNSFVLKGKTQTDIVSESGNTVYTGVQVGGVVFTADDLGYSSENDYIVAYELTGEGIKTEGLGTKYEIAFDEAA